MNKIIINTCSFHFNFLTLLIFIEFGETKISNLDTEVLVKKKICRLKVAVDNLKDLMKPNNPKRL